MKFCLNFALVAGTVCLETFEMTSSTQQLLPPHHPLVTHEVQMALIRAKTFSPHIRKAYIGGNSKRSCWLWNVKEMRAQTKFMTVNNISFILKAAEVLAEQLHHLVLHCSLKLDRSSNRRPSS